MLAVNNAKDIIKRKNTTRGSRGKYVEDRKNRYIPV